MYRCFDAQAVVNATIENVQDKQGSRHVRNLLILSGAALLTSHLLLNPAAAFIAASSIVAEAARPASPMIARWAFLFGTMVVCFRAMTTPFLTDLCALTETFLTWYLLRLERNPLVTKSTTSALLGIAGDYMAQWLEYELRRRQQHPSTTKRQEATSRFGGIKAVTSKLRINDTYDLNRSLAIAAEALIISGPLMHFGYDYFERLLPVVGHGSLAAFSHVLADTILLDSIFVATAIWFTGWFEGYHWRHDIWPQFRQDYIPTLKTSWATSAGLLPIQFLCFRFLPVALRMLSVNLLDILWDFVLSFMTHRKRTPLSTRRQQEEERQRRVPLALINRGGGTVGVAKTVNTLVGSM